MRAGRQNRIHSAVTVSLLLAACSVLGVISLAPTSSALLDLNLKSPTTSESQKPGLIKRITSSVPIVSSLLDKPSKPTSQPTTPTTQQNNSSTQQPAAQNSGNSAPTESKNSSPSATSSKENETKKDAQPASKPVINPQDTDVNTLQFVSSPYGQGDGRLISVPATQAAATFAVLEPSAEGWRVFGVAWYWWLVAAAPITAFVVWRERVFQLVAIMRARTPLLLRPKR